jgi:hypothetical protein
MDLDKQLQQDFFHLFVNKGAHLLSAKHLSALMEESYHGVEQIFKARYD